MYRRLKQSSFLVIGISLMLFIYQIFNLTTQEIPKSTTTTENEISNETDDHEILVSVLLLGSGIFLFKRAKNYEFYDQ